MASPRSAPYIGGLLSLALVIVVALVAPVACVCAGDPHGGQSVHPLFAHVHPDAPAPSAEPLAGAPALQGSSLAYAQSPALTGQVLADREPLSQPRDLGERLVPLPMLVPFSALGSTTDPPPRFA